MAVDFKALRDDLREHEKRVLAAEKAGGISVFKEKEAERKRVARADERLVQIHPCADRDRREEKEADDINWLMYYFGVDSGVVDPFWYEFTHQQRDMIESFGDAIKFGGDQAVAASRGEGKTTVLERLIIKYTLQGELKYCVLFQATGALADNSLDTVKSAIDENDLLYADYPEVCCCVRALNNTPQRAVFQIAKGKRHDNDEPFTHVSTHFKWCGQEIILPKVPGSPSSGAIIATRGLDASVRGLKRKGLRPQLAAIDDPDTEKTARSREQAEKLEDRIDKAIGGLGSQQKPIARIMLSTIQSTICCAYKFTDVMEKPSWKGKRFRYLITPPDRGDLWDEYVQRRADDFRNYSQGKSTDKHCRQSHQFFLDHRVEMEAGAVVANLNRYNGTLLPDGTKIEECALQHYYNQVARTSQEAVSTEYDNDPPEETGLMDSGISARTVQLKLSGYERGMVPPDCPVVTQGIDVKKTGLHWVIKAWRPDATNYVIDYGFYETHGTTYGSDEGVERAVYAAVIGRMEQLREANYTKSSGEPAEVNLTLIDSGWQTPTIYQACLALGMGYYPAKGHGKSNGCATMSYSAARKESERCQPGDGWRMDWQDTPDGRGVWLVNCDTDRWKGFEHARWLTPDGKAGAGYIYGSMSDTERYYIEKRLPQQSIEHHGFARHITSEIEVETMVRGYLRRVWKVKTGRVQNHWLDASYLADVAAALLDVNVLRAPAPEKEEAKPAVISSGSGRATASRW